MVLMGGLWDRLLAGPGRKSRRRAHPKRRQRPEFDALEGRALTVISTDLTVVANPNVLFPANDKYEPVTISGHIISTRPGPPKAAFFVVDEYRRDEPSGRVPLTQVTSNTYFYSFTIHLQAKNSIHIPDGRQYDITVAASDQDNAEGKTIAVVVPHHPLPFMTSNTTSTQSHIQEKRQKHAP
jgi:hypothetical protein